MIALYITSATPKRTLTVLKLLKTYLRAFMVFFFFVFALLTFKKFWLRQLGKITVLNIITRAHCMRQLCRRRPLSSRTLDFNVINHNNKYKLL